MPFDAAVAWVVLGGLLEPVWVVAMKKYDDTRSLGWGAVTAVFVVLSPLTMGMGMESMSVGVAYAMWTGIGTVCAMAVGYFLYHERVGVLKVLLVCVILAGVVGLELFTGGAR